MKDMFVHFYFFCKNVSNLSGSYIPTMIETAVRLVRANRKFLKRKMVSFLVWDLYRQVNSLPLRCTITSTLKLLQSQFTYNRCKIHRIVLCIVKALSMRKFKHDIYFYTYFKFMCKMLEKQVFVDFLSILGFLLRLNF